MSLINDALKRAQQAQSRPRPAPLFDPPLQPAIVSPTRSKRAPVLWTIAAVAFLGVALWTWRSTGRGVPPPLVHNPISNARLAPISAPVDAALEPRVPAPEAPIVAATAADAATPAVAQVEPAPEVAYAAPIQKPLTVKSASSSGLAERVTESKPASATTPTSAFNVYVVRSGDTLTRIARRHGTTVKALRESNDFKADRIVVGQRIKVPVLPSKASTGAA